MSYASHRFLYWHHPDLRARLRRTEAPTTKPLDLAAVVAHLRLDPGAEDGPEAALLDGMLAAATAHVEGYCSLAVMLQTWTLTLHDWPGNSVGLQLPYPPFASLESINANGTDQDIAGYTVDLDDRFPSTLYPEGGMWTQVTRGPGAISIVFKAGRNDPANVAPDIKQAILMAIATWYENRESLTQFALTPMIEIGWAQLLARYREEGFA
jgi:uncharacterized phiE125 gp8 family phage protein